MTGELITPILSVTEISLTLKNCVEKVFSDVKVKGEVSGIKKAASGHIYFSLKDSDSVLSAVCWRGRNAATIAALQEGLEVVCRGKLSTYPGRSNYQMIVETAEPAGVGALLKLLNERREKLAKEGLFDEARKKPIPYLPEVIGVVSSPSGAVIRDIMHRLKERFPRHVLLWPVPVQGEGAAEQIAAAVRGFNEIPTQGIQTINGFIPRPDVLIVARGGGSLEDLWCFNEEIVVRAVADCQIPVISAVGHETDTTLIDYVADLRAPTPTGAAEKAVPVRHELMTELQNRQARLATALYRTADDKKKTLESLGRALPNLSEIIENFVQKLDDRSERFSRAFRVFYDKADIRLKNAGQLLESYSYKSVLSRGFALITGPQGGIISHVADAQAAGQMQVCFGDGSVDVVVGKSDSYVRPLKSKECKKSGADSQSQGWLFDEK